MLFQKILHRVNFEEVTIETKLEKELYLVGDEVHGVVEVKAGDRDADLGYLYLYLKSECVKDPAQPLIRKEVKLDKFILGQPFHMKKGQVVHIPFSFPLPSHTPITHGSAKVFTHSGLDIHAGDDPEDIDYLEVGPSILQEKVFSAVELLGYKKGRTVYGPTERYQEYVQTFTYEKEESSILFSFISTRKDELVLYVKYFSSEELIDEDILTIYKSETDLEMKDKILGIVSK